MKTYVVLCFTIVFFLGFFVEEGKASDWEQCTWKSVGKKSHGGGPPWCDNGTFLTQLDLDSLSQKYNSHYSPVIGGAKCCGLANVSFPFWGNCKWVAVEQAGINSHQPKNWCPNGTFITQIDLDSDNKISAADSPVVGRVRCCGMVGVTDWTSCHWVPVEKAGLNSHQRGPDWCPKGHFLTSYDLDQEAKYSPYDSPIIGQARCCR